MIVDLNPVQPAYYLARSAATGTLSSGTPVVSGHNYMLDATSYAALSSGDTSTYLTSITALAANQVLPQPIQGVNGRSGAYVQLQTQDLLQGWVNVRDAGATGNGTADDTSAIQAAINAASTAGAGVVYVPRGTYKLSSALTVASGVTLVGDGPTASILHQTSTSADGIAGTDLQYVTVRDLGITGPGSGTGNGVHFTVVSAGATLYLDFKDVHVASFGGDGLNLELPIVSTFSRVVAESCGGWGFDLYGLTTGSQPPGTSCSLSACYGNGNTSGGYRLFKLAYTALNGCAADSQPVGYLVDTGYGVTLTGCGAEGNTTGVKISGGYGNAVTGQFIYNNQGTGLWVTGNAHTAALNQVSDVTPGVGAVNFIKTDAGSLTTITGMSNTSPNSFGGTVNILDDGGLGVVIGGYAYLGSTLEVASSVTVDSGDVVIGGAGHGLKVKEGTNAKAGTATLTAGTVTVSTTAVTANSRIYLTCQTPGGTVGALYVNARTAGTSFVVKSTSSTDTSTVAWMLVEPA